MATDTIKSEKSFSDYDQDQSQSSTQFDQQNQSQQDFNEQQDSNCGSGVDSPKYIRLRGLPWSATHQEILDFLKNVNVINGSKGIHLITSRWDGKNTGEAYVEVQGQQDVDEALKLNKASMGHRYIEVFTAYPKEAKEAMRKTGSHGGSYVVKLRGLPYSVTEAQIEDFFSGLEIKPDREGILFVMDRRGRATGEAFVQFESQDDTEQALGRNREKIGHRYIEIFRSSLAEMKRAANGNGRPGPYDLKDRGSNRGNNNDFIGGGRNNMRGGGGGGGGNWGNCGPNGGGGGGGGGNFGMGANNSLGFSNLPCFTNSGNFGNGFGPNNNNGNFGGNNGGGGGGGGGNNNGGGGGGGVGFGGNNRFNNPNGNFGNDFGDFGNFGNNRNFNGGGSGGGLGNNSNDFGNNRGGGGGGGSVGSNNGGGGGGNFGGFGNFGGNFGNGNGGTMGGLGNMGGNGGGGGGGNLGGNMGNNGGGMGGIMGGGMGGGMGGTGNNYNSNMGGGNFGPIGGGRGDCEYFTIHMRGLPYTSFENDVFKFFDPIKPANVRINYNKNGLHSGTADAYFDTYEDALLAMKRHREPMGSRYIELFFDGKTKANNMGGGGGGGGSGGGGNYGNSRRI